MTWKLPAEPRIAQAYTDALMAEDHDKAHAADTPFRFSDAMGCSRAAGYKAARVPITDPMDGPSLAITGLGSEGHEKVQAAITALFPGVEVETTGNLDDLVSGHIDIDDPDNDEAIEIKFVGAFKFDQSIGLFRSPGRGQPPRWRMKDGQRDPKGPSLPHVCQGGFNARSHGRSKVRIVYISREAVAVKKAAQLEMSPVERFAAEWVIPEDVWGPLVDAELMRLTKIRALVEQGVLPDRADFDDDGKQVKVDPETHWRCDYCPYATRCKSDGPGRVTVPRLTLVAS